MKFCVIIPCYNHGGTLGAVVRAAQAHGPVLVVDDGSTEPLPELTGVSWIRLEENRGKAAALRAGFWKAAELGFTHAITMDADGQHSAEDLPKFFEAAEAKPDALVVGVRDFIVAGAPAGRRRSNAISSFWFRVETGIRLGDTQCGFRCYPVSLTQRLRTRSGRYAFELEFMVRAAWVGALLVGVPVGCTYHPSQLRQSHFRPVVDFGRIAVLNVGLVLQSFFVPRTLRSAWSLGERTTFRQGLRVFFVEHAHDPRRLALAVGVGLFCGIAPIWGYQMLAAAGLAHVFRLNKAIALLVSNISIPPMMPFILYGALALGHWMFTGQALSLSTDDMTRARALEYLWQWLVGSVVLGAGVAVLGSLVTYGVASWVRKR